uniref:hypothetical protein n=1 Tax=Oricola nitratireducens TaxID=2775868 RepID=UPI001AEE07FB
ARTDDDVIVCAPSHFFSQSFFFGGFSQGRQREETAKMSDLDKVTLSNIATVVSNGGRTNRVEMVTP